MIIRVNSEHNETNTIPLKNADWYHYGGIFRSVEISEFKAEYIGSHKISYKMNEALTEAYVTVDFEVKNCNNEIPIKIKINGETVIDNTLPVIDGRVTAPLIHLDDIKLWDVGKGNLYTVHILLPNDDVVEKIGFREIEVKNTKFYLNRKEIFFKGVNRHEEHADWGFAVPQNISRRDIEIIKDLGCNMVRGSHYPQSQSWVDYLDREGILFWSEIPMWGWNYGTENLADPILVDRGLNMHKEMAEQYYHHPAIVVWGLHNEIHTDVEEAREISRKFCELLRNTAPDRLITYATDKYLNDICLEFVDFISLNYYFGWYKGTLNDWKDFIECARKVAIEKGVGEKPIIMSEFGCAALQGYSNFSGDKWTMQYQSEFLKTVIDLCVSTDGFCGSLVWQFADVKSSAGIAKARQFNNKGLVDEYRRPKMAYYTVKELYNKIK